LRYRCFQSSLFAVYRHFGILSNGSTHMASLQ
jgi:hypothetical protein